jgi:hypothetical protein
LTSGATRLEKTLTPSVRRFGDTTSFCGVRSYQAAAPFHLVDTRPGAHLHHRSDLGEFFLSSDSVIPTFTKWTSLKHITDLFPEEENEAFRTIGYTIGGMMVFPGNQFGGKHTINVARGFSRKIADRFDLTLECVRRHYLGQTSPLDETLARYRDFFSKIL